MPPNNHRAYFEYQTGKQITVMGETIDFSDTTDTTARH